MTSSSHFLSNEQLLDVFLLTKTATAIHVGEDAVIQMANEAMLSIWGKDKTVIGKSLEDALPELKGQPFIGMFREVWLDGLTMSGSDTPADLIVNGKKQTFYFEFEYRAIKNSDGKTLCILHTATDVTERVLNREALNKAQENEEALQKEQALNEELAAANEELNAINEELYQTQERLNELNSELEQRVASRVIELSESEERFRIMAEGTDIMIAVGDETSNAIYFNTAWINLTGRSMKDLLKFGWVDLVHPEDKDRYVNIYLSAFKKQVPFAGEFRVLNKEGDYRWLLASGPPRFRNDGSFAGYISSCIDITERKKYEQELQVLYDEMATGNEQFRLAIGTASLGTWRADINTGELIISERSRAIHGLSSDEKITLEESLQLILPEEREQIRATIQQAIEQAGNFEEEYRIQPKDGSPVKWLRSTGKAYLNEQGMAGHITGTILDITERKENELRKNDFIGMVSHELKTPLTSLTALIQLANVRLEKSDDTFLTGIIEKSNNQVKKMRTLINGFLDISRLESGKILVVKQDFNLSQLIDEMIVEIKIIVSSHTFEVSHCDPIWLHADRDKIGSVLSNLLSNAVKYSAKGTTVEVKCTLQAGHVQVSVKDSGIGIKATDIEKLFDRYYRVENVHTRHISGFGIGLYLSAEIIHRHNGKIWVESEPGKGSVFCFSLPLGVEK